MMKYKYILPTFCIFGTMSLYAEGKGLGSILQQAGQKKVLAKPISPKKESKKQTRFVFKDEYDANGIGSKEKGTVENKSETYDYDDKSRFKFKFNDGYDQSNLAGGSIGGGMGGAGGGGQGGGGGGRR